MIIYEAHIHKNSSLALSVLGFQIKTLDNACRNKFALQKVTKSFLQHVCKLVKEVNNESESKQILSSEGHSDRYASSPEHCIAFSSQFMIHPHGVLCSGVFN